MTGIQRGALRLCVLCASLFLTGCSETEETPAARLSYWVEIHPEAAKLMESYNENEAYREIQRRTGIEVEFIHPPLKQKREQFELLLASGDLPDIIGSVDHLGGYPGGPDKAVQDGRWLRLNELIEAHAPHYNALLKTNPEFRRGAVSPEGNISSFDMAMTEPALPWQGMIIRKDWLDILGHPVPETIDDWERALTGFKEVLHAEAPLNIRLDGAFFRSQVFAGAWNTGFCWINKEGRALWGPSTQEYRSFLLTLRRWYERGLLDPEFAIRHDDSIERGMITGRMGACNSYYAWYDVFLKANSDDPRYDLAGAPYPVLNRGDRVRLSHYLPANQQNRTVITSSCGDPVSAVKFLDYGYGAEGSLLLTYGPEGVSFERKEGDPYFTDLLLNNPDGLPYNTIQYRYAMNHGPFLIDGGKDRAKKMPSQITEAQRLWAEAGHDWMWPRMIYSMEEAQTISSLSPGLESYSLDMTLRFIMGLEDLNNWDTYVDELISRGLIELTEAKQSALDRHMSAPPPLSP